jgi:hypothetical protein
MPQISQSTSSKSRLYVICPNEQPRTNLVVFRQIKSPKQLPPSPYVPGVVRTLLGYDRGVGGIREVRSRYSKLVCPGCQNFDSDKIFAAGFDDDVNIHFRDDFAETNDFIFVISQRMLNVLRKGRVRGYEVKKVDKSGWYAMRVTDRVDSDPAVFRYEKPRCKECGDPVDGGGGHSLLSEIEPPSTANTFFTTKKRCLAREGPDRDLFCTEDVVLLLREHGIRKGSFHRLWTEDERAKRKAKEKQGILNWYPPKRIIYLP